MSIADPQDLINVLSRIEFWRQEDPVERKRAFRRFSVRGDATIESICPSVDDPERLTVQLRDISRGGVGFVTDHYLEPGEPLRMTFYGRRLAAGSQTLVVRYCRLIEEGAYLVGGQFTIDPHLMAVIGVPMGQLLDDVKRPPGDAAVDQFVTPDDLEADED